VGRTGFPHPQGGKIKRVSRKLGLRQALSGALVVGLVLILTRQAAMAQTLAQDSSVNSTTSADPNGFWSNCGRWTFGAQLGFALENDIPHNISHIAILMAQPSVGLTLLNFHSPGFPISRFSVVSEGILGGAVHPGGHVIGHALLFRLDGKPVHRVVPFFNVGAGVLHTSVNDRAPELSGSTQFNPQGGLGIQYFFRPQRAFVLEYRYMHMSNNGIQEPNLGFNSSMITIGFRWLRRPRPLGSKVTEHGHNPVLSLSAKK